MPKGRESQGDGVPIVVVGVMPHQGEWESHSQGKGVQVTKMYSHQEVREMRTAELELNIIKKGYERAV